MESHQDNPFGHPTMANNSHHTMPWHQQANQQQFITNNKTTIPQQELYSSGSQYHLYQPIFDTLHHHHHLQQQHQHHQQQQQHHHQQLNSVYGLSSRQPMLDAIHKQQHAAAAFTYGRQPRQANDQLPPLPPPINSSKSQNTLASVLQSNQTLNHLTDLSLSDNIMPTMMDSWGPKKMSHHQFPSASSSVGGGATGGLHVTSRKWKRAQQRIQNFAYKYSTLLRCSMFFILLAFTTMSIIKFTSIPSATLSHNSNNLAQTYPTNKALGSAARPDVDFNKWAVTEQYSAGDSSTISPDVLSSKLLIGEFVILSQNYTNSEAQRSVLAENIVKLMDQVFLSTDVRRVYSRMQVIGIRPHMPSGIVVKCNIILSESIIYAAQQFGIALYDSLAKSNEKLANQPSFIIDKNSIRFNTIPDKDLAIVPPQLLPTVLTQADTTPSPSDGSAVRQQLDDLKPHPATTSDQSQDQNAVVWSEWSQWSSCVDKNGMCDPTRLHSRLRKCVSQHTGEKVEAAECRQRFNMQDLELEVTDCSTTCASSVGSGSQQQAAGVQSDAPLVIMPHTAPSMMVAGSSSEPFLLPAPLNRAIKQNGGQQASAQKIGPFDPIGMMQSNGGSSNGMDIYSAGPGADSSSPASSSSGRQQAPTSSMMNAIGLLTSTQTSATSVSSQDGSSVVSPATQASAPILPMAQLDSQQQQMSCSNCTSDEICLLLITQKVPFCAKIKDRLDESGCGGWCKAQDQLCQPAGQNAFKCTHNSECLPDEWRCHDSACIPASKRCDGHENCFDSSDERYCPST